MNKVEFQHHLRDIARLWFEKAGQRYTSHLAAHFHRRAIGLNPNKAAPLLSQAHHINSSQHDLQSALADFVTEQLNGDAVYQSGTHPQLDRIVKYLGDDALAQLFCRAISPMTVFSGFQHLSHCMNLKQDYLDDGVTLFNQLVLKELHKLYQRLLDTIARERSNQQVLRWVQHIQKQLASGELSAEQRALAERRLARLKGEIQLPPPNTPSSTQTLQKEVERVFADKHGLPALPIAITHHLQTLQQSVYQAAKLDPALFYNPLHPARRLVRQLLVALSLWNNAPGECRRSLAVSLTDFLARFEGARDPRLVFIDQAANLEESCKSFIRITQFKMRGDEAKDKHNQRLTQLRGHVHNHIRKKLAGLDVPEGVNELLMGPWTTVVLYHWLRHGRDSLAAKRRLRFIDEIIWYITPHDNWTELSRAKAMSKQIEEELLEGMGRINTAPERASRLIAELHRCRLSALATSGNALLRNIPAS